MILTHEGYNMYLKCNFNPSPRFLESREKKI